MNSDGEISLSFSKNLETELNANLLSFKSESTTYDSPTFSLSTVTSLTEYTITLYKILLTGMNTMRLYLPSGSNILLSDVGENLATEYLDILITAPSITKSCSSISNCYTCSITETDFI